MTSLFAPKIQSALEYRQSLGKSIQQHTLYLRSFDKFCSEKHPDKSILTKEIAWDWVYDPLKVNKYAIRSRIQAIALLGEYLTALGEDAYIFPDAMTSAKYIPAPHIFTDDELRCFFTAADSFTQDLQDPLQHRIIPVIFRLIYTCGLRPKEGRELKRANVNLDTGEILITNTKNQKERFVVMSDDMLEFCRKYECYRNADAPVGNEYFFPTQHGDCYNRNQLSRFFKQCWSHANDGDDNLPRVRVYDLRHRFASAILNRWIDEKRDLYAMLPYLRAYMGHTALSSTEYYIHLLPENLVKSRGINWSGLESLIPEV